MEVKVIRKIGTDTLGVRFWGLGWYTYLRRERGTPFHSMGGPYATERIAVDAINAIHGKDAAGHVIPADAVHIQWTESEKTIDIKERVTRADKGDE